jgi:hypothetical protein
MFDYAKLYADPYSYPTDADAHAATEPGTTLLSVALSLAHSAAAAPLAFVARAFVAAAPPGPRGAAGGGVWGVRGAGGVSLTGARSFRRLAIHLTSLHFTST